jgi:L-threonylcarbamoyladenylate synthase
LRYVSTSRAADLLREGKIGLIPTETVVGLVAGEIGLPRLFEIKGRDPAKPIALLYSSAKEAFALPSLSHNLSPLARSLADRYWPGPLTLVLGTESGTTVGVRVPAHPVVQAVLASYGEPLYATSANRSGENAPHDLEEVDPEISHAVDFAVEGSLGSGEASAVVDLSGAQVRLLRSSKSLDERELFRLANSE